MQSEQIAELAAALAKAQGAMRNAAMNRVNPHFKSRYADLASVLDAVRTPLSANGLSIVQTMQPSEQAIILRTTLLHASGQYIATEYLIPKALKPHEMGSALTYGRRYSVAALICNSADEDDDGDAAMKGHHDEAVITQEQADEIRALLAASKKDVGRFLSLAGAPSISDIAASKYDRCIGWLKS